MKRKKEEAGKGSSVATFIIGTLTPCPTQGGYPTQSGKCFAIVAREMLPVGCCPSFPPLLFPSFPLFRSFLLLPPALHSHSPTFFPSINSTRRSSFCQPTTYLVSTLLCLAIPPKHHREAQFGFGFRWEVPLIPFTLQRFVLTRTTGLWAWFASVIL